eukprot:15144-Heterococcus_DN1.PRE.3
MSLPNSKSAHIMRLSVKRSVGVTLPSLSLYRRWEVPDSCCTALATAAAAAAVDTAVLPHSRRMELEADFIGMHLMASSCYYDPREAIQMLTKLKSVRGESDQFERMLRNYLETHPAEDDRIKNLQVIMDRALCKAAEVFVVAG